MKTVIHGTQEEIEQLKAELDNMRTRAEILRGSEIRQNLNLPQSYGALNRETTYYVQQRSNFVKAIRKKFVEKVRGRIGRVLPASSKILDDIIEDALTILPADTAFVSTEVLDTEQDKTNTPTAKNVIGYEIPLVLAKEILNRDLTSEEALVLKWMRLLETAEKACRILAREIEEGKKPYRRQPKALAQDHQIPLLEGFIRLYSNITRAILDADMDRLEQAVTEGTDFLKINSSIKIEPSQFHKIRSEIRFQIQKVTVPTESNSSAQSEQMMFWIKNAVIATLLCILGGIAWNTCESKQEDAPTSTSRKKQPEIPPEQPQDPKTAGAEKNETPELTAIPRDKGLAYFLFWYADNDGNKYSPQIVLKTKAMSRQELKDYTNSETIDPQKETKSQHCTVTVLSDGSIRVESKRLILTFPPDCIEHIEQIYITGNTQATIMQEDMLLGDARSQRDQFINNPPDKNK